MNKVHLTAILLSLYLASLTTVAKPAKCQKYKDKYTAIQAKQKQPQSVKQSNKLKDKELKALHKWQRCKQGKIK